MGLVAYLALLGYPAVVVGLFLFLRPREAVFWSYFLGWLYLPLGAIDLPGLPAYGKFTTSSILIVPCIFLFDPGSMARWRWSWVDGAVVMLVMSPFVASITNSLGVYDGISALLSPLLVYGIPYVTGKLYLQDAKGVASFSRNFVFAALTYTPLCLLETRLSPLFHYWIYGYSGRASWSYDGRFGPFGWTPTVFMNSAFEVSLLMTMATLLTFWTWRTKAPPFQYSPMPTGYLFFFFFGILVLCKKLTGVVLSSLGLLLLKVRSRSLFLAIASFPMLYVICFSTGVWRGEGLSSNIAMLSKERANSLQYRLDGDIVLITKAMEKPLFGWGGWGRNRIYNEEGRDTSVTDSMFLISLGTMGFVGLLSQMVMYLGPATVYFAFHFDEYSKLAAQSAIQFYLPLSLILVLHAIDDLFNAFPNPIYPLIAGGVAGYCCSRQKSFA